MRCRDTQGIRASAFVRKFFVWFREKVVCCGLVDVHVEVDVLNTLSIFWVGGGHLHAHKRTTRAVSPCGLRQQFSRSLLVSSTTAAAKSMGKRPQESIRDRVRVLRAAGGQKYAVVAKSDVFARHQATVTFLGTSPHEHLSGKHTTVSIWRKHRRHAEYR